MGDCSLLGLEGRCGTSTTGRNASVREAALAGLIGTGVSATAALSAEENRCEELSKPG